MPDMESHSDDILPPPREFKLKNPWVGVGCAATVGALATMIYASHTGHTNLLQHSMRARVALQGATVVIMAASSGYVLRDKIFGLFPPAEGK